MAIDTNNEKFALIDMGDIWAEALPTSSDGLGQDDKQQLLWGYPGVLWVGGAASVLRNNPMMVTLGKMMNR